jgi:hypothetical protein
VASHHQPLARASFEVLYNTRMGTGQTKPRCMVERTQRHSKVHKKEAEQLRYVNTLLEIGMALERTRKHVNKVIRRLRTGGFPIMPVSLEQSSTSSHALNGISAGLRSCAFPFIAHVIQPRSFVLEPKSKRQCAVIQKV